VIDFIERFLVVVASFVGPLLIGWLIVAWLDSCRHGGRKR
jgi:hypothetical protein